MSILETSYIRKWAQAIVDREGREALRLPHDKLRARVTEILRPLGPTEPEIAAITMGIEDLIRRDAPPADSPRVRGPERMYR